MKKIGHGSYPLTRMRRNRTKLFSRELLKENRLSTHDIILPVFVTDGEKKTIPITTMPGVFVHSSDNILNTPISPVLFTCVPPHNSVETSPKLNTLTVSSYFSPKSAIAPAEMA